MSGALLLQYYAFCTQKHEEIKVLLHYEREELAASCRREEQRKALFWGIWSQRKFINLILRAEKSQEKLSPVSLLYKRGIQQNYFHQLIQSEASRSSDTPHSFHSPDMPECQDGEGSHPRPFCTNIKLINYQN